MIYTIYTIRMIRKTPNFLPAIAGIALMTITACASANLGDFSKATQDAAIAAALASATAEATAAAQTAATDAAAAQKRAVDSVRAELECTTPVCDNVVNADDLPSYPTTVTSAASTFLTITGTEINTAGIRRGGNADPIIHKATRADICEARGGDEATCAPTKNANNMDDGFQHFSGEFAGSNTIHFAGILPTTNLGAPLTAQPTTAVWPGFIFNGAAPHEELDFNIDFANRRITAGYARPVASFTFNLSFSDSGVISGQVLEHDLALTSPVLGFAHATGLIGTEGLVGVYFDSVIDPTATDIFGGFVADNPDTN
ncbi:MAG: hypothetical protein ACNYPD_03905 [Candidatus Halichondribacter symbioticus]